MSKKVTNSKRHIVLCEHCKKEVLDHMTECPFCHKKLKGNGYKPMTEEEIKRIKTPLTVIGLIIAAIIVAIWIFLKI